MAHECYFKQPEKLKRLCKRRQLLALCFHLVVRTVHCRVCFSPVAPLSSQSYNPPLWCVLSGGTHADDALPLSLYFRESNEYERLLRVTLLLLLLLVLPAAADAHRQRARCGQHVRHGLFRQPAPLQRALGLRPQEASLQRGGAQAAANDQESPQDPGAGQHESKFWRTTVGNNWGGKQNECMTLMTNRQNNWLLAIRIVMTHQRRLFLTANQHAGLKIHQKWEIAS